MKKAIIFIAIGIVLILIGWSVSAMGEKDNKEFPVMPSVVESPTIETEAVETENQAQTPAETQQKVVSPKTQEPVVNDVKPDVAPEMSGISYSTMRDTITVQFAVYQGTNPIASTVMTINGVSYDLGVATAYSKTIPMQEGEIVIKTTDTKGLSATSSILVR